MLVGGNLSGTMRDTWCLTHVSPEADMFVTVLHKFDRMGSLSMELLLTTVDMKISVLLR